MADLRHVLIVVDEPLIVEVLQETLETHFRVSSVSTVRGALAFLQSSHVDIVLLDAVLSDGRSEEVGHVARALGVAVIEMSGYPQVMVDLESSDRPHLCKPFGSERLLSTIAAALHPISKAGKCAAGMRRPKKFILCASVTAAWSKRLASGAMQLNGLL